MVGDSRVGGALLLVVAAAAGCTNGSGGSFDDGPGAPPPTQPASLCGTVTIVSQPQIWGLELAVDGGQVYYTAYGAGPDQHQHQIWSVPAAGGEPSLVWQGSSGILGSGMRIADGLAYLSAELAWNGAGEGVLGVALAGGPATVEATFGTACAAYGDMALDDVNVYAGSNGCGAGAGQILAVPRAGGAATTLWSGDGPLVGSAALAVRKGEVYFLLDDDGDGDGVVMTLATSGAATPVSIGTAKEAHGIAVDDDGVYVTAGSALLMLPADGSPTVTLATGLLHPGRIAVDASGIYVVLGGLDDGAMGSVVRVPHGGGATTVLADGQPAIFALALDERAVYWASQTGSMVARAGKCL
jgi:hypothetical protein